MRSLFLLGFPRCGAGLLARGLRPAGYDLGSERAPTGRGSAADAAAPRALVEAGEALLAGAGAPVALRRGWRWCAGLEVDARIEAEPAQRAALRSLLEREPFCLWDARLVWTLPVLREFAPGAAQVCLFRDPREQVAALLEAAQRDSTLREGGLETAALIAEWTRAYRRVVEHLAQEGDWLFLHRDQLLRGADPGRLLDFTGAGFDPRVLEPALAREAPAGAPQGEAGALYAELCARAGFEPRSAGQGPRARASAAEPEVAALVPIREGQAELARATLDALLAQRGIACEVFAIDQTLRGGFEQRGVRVLREPSPARGRAYRTALAASAAPFFAWAEPGSRALPQRLARSLRAARAAPEVDLWTCDLGLGADGERPALRIGEPHEPPHGGWVSTVLVRRELLATIDARAFTPAELELLRTARAGGRAAHLGEALVELPASLAAALDERSRQDAALLDLHARAPLETPLISVLLACHDREDVIETCLEGFARQLVPPGTLEIVVVDDGSRDASPERILALELAVPLELVRQCNAGAAAARNNGIPRLRGLYTLLVNDDTVPFPDTVARHLAALAELDDPRAIVLGTFEQPKAQLDNALVRLLERTTYVFGYPEHTPGAVLPGEHFYTCNVSLETQALRAAGGFDPEFPCYAEDTELGLRLERSGYRVHYRPEARARHHHVPHFDALRWRQQAVARAHVRLFARHPGHTFGSLSGLTRAEVGELERRVGPFMGEIEAAARTLAEIDLGALERVGGDLAGTARLVEESLGAVLARLNGYWWRRGSERGLAELGVSGFPELLARRPLEFAGLPPDCALVRADGGGEWIATLEAWLERRPAERAPAVLVAIPQAQARCVSAVAQALAALAARAARRGIELRPFLTLAEGGGTCARFLGAAGVWLATPADGEGLRAAAAALGVPTWTRAGAVEPRPAVVGEGSAALCIATPVAEVGEPSFGSFFEACAPLLGRSDATLVLLHPPTGAERAALVQNVLHAALCTEDGAPEVRLLVWEGAACAALGARLDLLLDPARSAPADLDGVPTVRDGAGLEAALRALDAAARAIPFLFAREPQHA